MLTKHSQKNNVDVTHWIRLRQIGAVQKHFYVECFVQHEIVYVRHLWRESYQRNVPMRLTVYLTYMRVLRRIHRETYRQISFTCFTTQMSQRHKHALSD